LFGRLWLFLDVVLLLASVALRQGLLFSLALIFLLSGAVAWVWSRHCLQKVEYRRHLGRTRAFFGEEIDLTVEVVNRKLLPLAWLQTSDEFPRPLEVLQGEVWTSYRADRALLTSLLSLRWYERARLHYRVRCCERGDHVFGPVKLQSGDVFGFQSQEIDLPVLDHLLVYPRVVSLAQLGLPSRHPFGDFKTRQWLFEDPLRSAGTREYAPGDSPRRIHWKATARSQQLQVKLFEPTTTYDLVIFLNLNTSGPRWWSQVYEPDLLEFAVMAGASIAQWAVERGYLVGLCANGSVRTPEEKIKIAPNRDPEQLTHILEALARVRPFATMPLEELLLDERSHLPFGSTVVVLTALMSDEIVAELDALRAARHSVSLLLVGGEEPLPRLEGISVHRLAGEAAWRQTTEVGVG
jgi:uncharacterized protein (DUF58 family)